jgi:protein-S-isoprenylcysteine O-methyltransferase Ste14
MAGRPGTGRGEGWVVAQFPLFGLAVQAPHLGPAWPRALARSGRLAGLPLLAAGAYLAARGLLDLGASFTPLPKPKDDARLVREGAYRIVRHPIYAGATLGALGWALLTANTTRLALAGVVLLFFDAKAHREEAWLVEKYPAYAAYRREVRKLLPGLY